MTVNLSLVGGAAAQFFDNNGNVLSGGKIYTYLAGSTTPSSTFTSVSGITYHTNPIILDSAGRVPGGEIWVTPSLSYKFVIYTSTDVLLGTYDNLETFASNAANVVYDPAGTGAQPTTVQAKLREWVSVTDFIPPGTNTLTTDCAPYFQAAIDYCMKQYDPTETTMNGNDVSYFGQQKTLWVPVGRYSIGSTLNLSFRNQIEMVGEDEWNTVLWWTGALDGMIIDARCSSYVKFRNFTMDGYFKAQTFIYCAGNGNNAPGSKGNVTGNYFGHLYFWNQKGDLVPPYTDWEDQYDPRSAMLNTISIDTTQTFYNSMDDSTIEWCRFAPNSLNNSYAIGISSSANSITKCQFFSANGVLCYNGAQFWMSDCIGSMYAPRVQDAQHNHALIKCNYNAGGGSIFRGIEIHHSYLEGQDYYGNGHSVKMLYWAQGGVVAPEDEGVLNFYVNGGTYGGTGITANYTYIDVQARRRANIKLINTSLQGPAKLYIYAPDSAVEISDNALSLNGFSQETQTWQILDAGSVTHKYQTPEFQIEGARVPDVQITVGTSDYPNQLKFLTLDEALIFCSQSKGNVTIYLDQDDTVSIGTTINCNMAIALAGRVLTIDAPLFSKGNLTISNDFTTTLRDGTVKSTSTKYLLNQGNMTIKNCYVDNAIQNSNGTLTMFNVQFIGTNSSVINNESGTVMVDSDTCVFSGSGYVVDLGPKYGNVVAKSISGTIPTTGLWMRGTRLEFSNPSTGFPNQYWATANGIGVAATWANSGNLV